MKTRRLTLCAALLASLAAFCVFVWQPVSPTPPAKIPSVSAVPEVVTSNEPATTPPLVSRPAEKIETQQYRVIPAAATLYSAGADFEGLNSTQFSALLAEWERMPESPVKDDAMHTALRRWASLDGSAAAQWAATHPGGRRFLPDTLTAWAGHSADAAASAWAFAKANSARDGDEAVWHAPEFVTAAFRGMTATPGEAVWNELASLSGATSAHAVFGMADFAVNGQTNTEFAAAVEQRVLGIGSAQDAAAFHAAGGFIQAAKDDFVGVTQAAQWHAIAREIARQQAETEPSKAIEWLQSQFPQPAEAIADMTESIAMMHALNAGDVLNWLGALPDTEERRAAIEKIRQKFPQFRADLPTETITLN